MHWQSVNLGGLLIIRTLFNVDFAETVSNDRMTAYSALERYGRKQSSTNLR